MRNIIFMMLSKLFTIDNMFSCIGFLLSKLLLWARKLDNWDLLKAIISKFRGWLDVIDQVIEDDTLTEYEEKLIADALKNSKAVTKIIDVIKPSEENKNDAAK